MALIRISFISPSSDAIRNSFVMPPAAGRSWVGLLSVIPVCCVVLFVCYVHARVKLFMPHLFRLGLSPFSLSMALFDIPNSLPCLPCQASVHQCEVICFYFIFWTMLFLTIMRLHALDTRSEGQYSHPAAVGESRI